MEVWKSYQWNVNIASNHGLVPSGNRPLLTRSISPYCVARPQWVDSSKDIFATLVMYTRYAHTKRSAVQQFLLQLMETSYNISRCKKLSGNQTSRRCVVRSGTPYAIRYNSHVVHKTPLFMTSLIKTVAWKSKWMHYFIRGVITHPRHISNGV